MNLPIDFTNRMKKILQDEYPSFEASYLCPAKRSVHLNFNRGNRSDIEECAAPQFVPMNFPANGFFYDTTQGQVPAKLGCHPLHHAGALYSQDPAAMLPVNGITIDPNWRVLDLCAAPGGKSSQIATILSSGKGSLISNEINPSRNKILISNMERMGYTNVLVTKLMPDELAAYYPGYFNMILVDAPCSGEGMFRKYPESITEWSLENVKLCQLRQKEILSHALTMLQPGGFLIYSTCTYSVEENEAIVEWLIKDNHMIPVPFSLQIEALTANAYSDNENVIKCSRRFYPHLNPGEGQFMAFLQKEGTMISDNTISNILPPSVEKEKLSTKKVSLIKETLGSTFNLSKISFYEHQERIYILPEYYAKLPPHGMTLCGVTAGSIIKNRFVPHHHFFHAYGELCTNICNLDDSDHRIDSYLSGNEITDDNVKNGYGVVFYKNIPVGGFKASNGRLKNHYPKALRNLN